MRTVILGDLPHNWSKSEEEGGVLCAILISKFSMLSLLVLLMVPFFLSCTRPGIP